MTLTDIVKIKNSFDKNKKKPHFMGGVFFIF